MRADLDFRVPVGRCTVHDDLHLQPPRGVLVGRPHGRRRSGRGWPARRPHGRYPVTRTRRALAYVAGGVMAAALGYTLNVTVVHPAAPAAVVHGVYTNTDSTADVPVATPPDTSLSSSQPTSDSVNEAGPVPSTVQTPPTTAAPAPAPVLAAPQGTLNTVTAPTDPTPAPTSTPAATPTVVPEVHINPTLANGQPLPTPPVDNNRPSDGTPDPSAPPPVAAPPAP